jgi:hypothetical protein
MPRLLHRHREFLTSSVLAIWMFALFVGIANACSWDGVTAVRHQSTAAIHADSETVDHDMAPACENVGSNDLPLLSVLQRVQEKPAGQPLVLATRHDLGSRPISAPNLRWVRHAHPSPGVPYAFRFVRLKL